MLKLLYSSVLLLAQASAGEQFAANVLFGASLKASTPTFTLTSGKNDALLSTGQLPMKSDGTRFKTTCDGKEATSVFVFSGDQKTLKATSSDPKQFSVSVKGNEVSVTFLADAAIAVQQEALITVSDSSGEMSFYVGGAVTKGMLAVYEDENDVVELSHLDFGSDDKLVYQKKTIYVKNNNLVCNAHLDEVKVTKNSKDGQQIATSAFDIYKGVTVAGTKSMFEYDMDLEPGETGSVKVQFAWSGQGTFAGEIIITSDVQDDIVFTTSACIGGCTGNVAPTSPPTPTSSNTEPTPIVVDADNSCTGKCATSATSGDCWCDDLCHTNSDCCADFATECPTIHEATKPGDDDGAGDSPTSAPVDPNSCKGVCGSSSTSGKCWCDDVCTVNKDCCDDYEGECKN